MAAFEVGDWVRLQNNCDLHPSKRMQEDPPREFIGVYLGNMHVNWLCSELPEYEPTHWAICLDLFQRKPKPDGAV